MSGWPEHVRLRVMTDKVELWNISVPVPKGEYDGYIDWQNGSGGERYMTSTRCIEASQFPHSCCGKVPRKREPAATTRALSEGQR